MKKNNNAFSFFVPAEFEKGIDKVTGQKIIKVKGVCSTTDSDLDKQTLHPVGFDFSPLLNNGFINYNHQWKTNPNAIIGEATSAKLIDNNTKMYLEGFLYADSKKAQEVMELDGILRKNSKKRLGWSIEGQTLETDPFDKSIVTKALITGVAITPNPKNSNTLVEFLKGQTHSSHEDEDEEEEEEDLGDTEPGEEIEKMDTGSMPMVESVEGGHKKRAEVDQLRDASLILTKSQVYEKIFQTFPSIEREVCKKVFNFITINNSTMSNEIIEKSIQILEGTASSFDEMVNDLSKGKEDADDSNMSTSKNSSKEDDSDEDDFGTNEGPTGNEEQEEMDDIAKSQYAEGVDPDEIIEHLVKSGFKLTPSMTTVTALLSEYSGKKNGTESVHVSAPIVKSIEAQPLEVVRYVTPEIDYSQLAEAIGERFDAKFKALGNLAVDNKSIIKSQSGEFSELKRMIEDLSSELNTPTQRKSIMKGQVAAIERFEPGVNNAANNPNVYDYRTATRQEKNDFGDKLFQKSQELHGLGGRKSQDIDIAVQELEMVGMIQSVASRQAVKSHLGIEVIV